MHLQNYIKISPTISEFQNSHQNFGGAYISLKLTYEMSHSNAKLDRKIWKNAPKNIVLALQNPNNFPCSLRGKYYFIIPEIWNSFYRIPNNIPVTLPTYKNPQNSNLKIKQISQKIRFPLVAGMGYIKKNPWRDSVSLRTRNGRHIL